MMKLENLLAVRFINARKSNKLLSFLSIISIIGIMLGVATLITVVSVMDGFSENLKDKFIGNNPHIIIQSTHSRNITDWEYYVDSIKDTKGILGVAPLILEQAIIATKNNSITGVMVKGIDPETEENITNFPDTVIIGSFDNFKKNSDSVLLGLELAASNGLKIGDDITLMSPVMTKSAFGYVPKMRRFKVAGFFDTGIHDQNKSLIYINLKTAQDFFMMGDTISIITVYTNNLDNSGDLSKIIQQQLNKNSINSDTLWARDWLSMNGTLFAALKLEQFAMFVILTLIIIVASFNIVSMITVSVKNKIREIAIIRAMGGSITLIKNIFIKQGLTIGFIGIILGDILAFIIGYILKNYEIIKIPKEIYHTSTVPIKMSFFIFFIVTVCAIIITYIASIIPSTIAAKSDPIKAIRNE